MEMRDLPSVDALAAKLAADTDLPSALVLQIARDTIERARTALLEGRDVDNITGDATERVKAITTSRPTAIINGTGVLLHTNLGRAPLPNHAARASEAIAVSASNVELDITTGTRSKRHDYLGALLPVVTGAEAGFAVNNNAGALLLALASIAGHGGSVAVSRGELIEIGGSFRLPSLMEASGAHLVEVGTTNRTRLSDYAAVAGDVDAILKVHPSNYRIDGFAEEASYAALADVASSHGVPFIADIGSGLMDETAPWLGSADHTWLGSEPGVVQTVAAGADLVLFSGDKLLGGPQAGIIVGKEASVQKAMQHPIARAVRLDGPSIASLCSVLESYANADVRSIPFWAMATATVEELAQRANAIAQTLGSGVSVTRSEAVPGAGSVPGRTIDSIALRIDGHADGIWRSLASHTPAVIATRRDGAVYVDLRSVDPSHDDDVTSALRAALA